jgi:hypothetical protein
VKTLRETILKNSWQEDMVGPHLVRVDDALSALRQWIEDEGLAIVPKKATGAMFSAALQRDDHGDLYHGIYTAMIAAAPDALKAPDPAP